MLAARPFKEMKANYYVVITEFLLISYYMALIVGILSIQAISIETIGSACIKIIIVALGANVIFSIFDAAHAIYSKTCGKKYARVHPNVLATASAANVTMAIELDDVFHRPSKGETLHAFAPHVSRQSSKVDAMHNVLSFNTPNFRGNVEESKTARTGKHS